jgi:hypothetical protein
MSLNQDERVDHSDLEAVPPTLLIGFAMVAIVAFSYWLNMW